MDDRLHPYAPRLLAAAALALLLAAPSPAAPAAGAGSTPSPDTDLDRYMEAWHAECALHDVTEARRLYKQILETGSSPRLRAMAGLRLAVCQEKLGDPAQALETLFRLTQEFAGETDMAEVARVRLALLQARRKRVAGGGDRPTTLLSAVLTCRHGDAEAQFYLGDPQVAALAPGFSWSLAVSHQEAAPLWIYILKLDLGAAPTALRLVPDQFNRDARPMLLEPGTPYRFPADADWGLDELPERTTTGRVLWGLVTSASALDLDRLDGMRDDLLKALTGDAGNADAGTPSAPLDAADWALRTLAPSVKTSWKWIEIKP